MNRSVCVVTLAVLLVAGPVGAASERGPGRLRPVDPLAEPAPKLDAGAPYLPDDRAPTEKIVPRLMRTMATVAGETRLDIVVTLQEPLVGLAARPGDPSGDEIRARHIAALEHEFVALARSTGFEPRYGLQHSPVVVGTITRGEVERLAALPIVRAVEVDFTLFARRVEGGALIAAPALRVEGGRGAGIGVAVLDSGIDGFHAELPWGTKITAWADFTGTQSANDAGMDDQGHGTSCAGIIAGLEGGMAPEAHLWALKVLDSNGEGPFSNTVQALDTVYENRDQYGGIRVVSISIGGDEQTNAVCDDELVAMTTAMSRLVAAGVAIFVSAGNGGCANGIEFPACISHAIAVGAVYDANVGTASFDGYGCIPNGCDDAVTAADKVTCYSNSGALLDILAPSHCADTTAMGGGYDTCFGGTSAACPYAAGAAAQILSQRPSTTVAELRSALKTTGRPVTDIRNGVTRRRIDALQAYRALTGGSGSADNVYWVPVVSHAPGAGGSQWRADVGAQVPGLAAANLAFTLFTATQSPSGTAVLGAGQQGIFGDIAGQLGVTSGSGALRIESDQPLHVTARVFNQAPTGTFGQYLDGFTVDRTLAAGATVTLPHLVENASFRTNLGFTNTGSAPATVNVTLFSNTGAAVGTFGVSIPPGQWKGENQPYKNRFGRTNIYGYATVTVASGSGVIAYASVVDNATGDPTTIPMKE
jgi:subtilisin family serine protease